MKFDSEKKIKVVVHDPCRDGKTAMLAAKMKLGDEAEYFGESHANWNVTKSLLKDEHVSEYVIYFVDICPPREMLIELEGLSKNTFVLDHHRSAMKECEDLWFCMFDMNRSGAGLAWDYFMKTERPMLVNLVEDYDLWRFNYPETHPFSAWMDTQDLTTERLAEVLEMLEDTESLEKIVSTGQSYLDYTNFIIQQQIVTGRKVQYLELDGHKIVAVNTSIFTSETGNYIANKTDNGAAVIYYRSKNGYHFSLRSTKEGLDVSEIAKNYGGGGNSEAAGFIRDDLSGLKFTNVSHKEFNTIFPKGD